MPTIRSMTLAGAVAGAVAAIGAAPVSSAASDPQRLPGWQVPVYAAPGNGTQTDVEDTGAGSARATSTFNVTYVGFSAEAKAAFQRAVNTWKTKVNSPVPITVRATWEPLGGSILGSAGPSYGWNIGGIMYTDALANKKAGRNLNAAPDIVAHFNSNFSNWYFGTGSAPAGKYDFQSVVTHELGHGLGFLGAGHMATRTTGSVKIQGLNIIYDRFTKLGSATSSQLLWKMPDRSIQLGNALRSNNLYFDSPAVRAANNSRAAKIYAPSTWRQGSSYSHLDEATFPRGNQNSLMTYAIAAGETIRTPGPVSLAIFKTIGW